MPIVSGVISGGALGGNALGFFGYLGLAGWLDWLVAALVDIGWWVGGMGWWLIGWLVGWRIADRFCAVALYVYCVFGGCCRVCVLSASDVSVQNAQTKHVLWLSGASEALDARANTQPTKARSAGPDAMATRAWGLIADALVLCFVSDALDASDVAMVQCCIGSGALDASSDTSMVVCCIGSDAVGASECNVQTLSVLCTLCARKKAV